MLMTTTIETIDDLHRRLVGAGDAADPVSFALAGAIVLYKDAGTAIEYGEGSGAVTLVINQRRHILRPDREARRIDVGRDGAENRMAVSLDASTTLQAALQELSRLEEAGYW
jgi:hypothetical protein